MKHPFIILFCLLFLQIGWAQENTFIQPPENGDKGKFYFYWGYNRGWFSKSTLQFNGEHYNFKLKNVIAKDRQTSFDFNTYFNPALFTIPQYNVRIGYLLNQKYSVSFGTDHMKYVVQNNQTVTIDGSINESETTYDGNYDNEEIILTSEFLQFEHTDGLNYVNVDGRRHHTLFSSKNFELQVMEGVGLGVLIPKTNAKLLGNPRHDKFHCAGFGVSALGSTQLIFFKHFFIQSEFKTGFINLPTIRTSLDKVDTANQHFFFTQLNFLIGAKFRLKKQ